MMLSRSCKPVLSRATTSAVTWFAREEFAQVDRPPDRLHGTRAHVDLAGQLVGTSTEHGQTQPQVQCMPWSAMFQISNPSRTLSTGTSLTR